MAAPRHSRVMKRFSIGLASTLALTAATIAVAAPSRRPELPAIRMQAANTVPACVSPERMMAHLTTRNSGLDAKYRAIAADYKKHGDALKVRWDWAFYQMLLETNYLKFRRGDGTPGDVKPRQNNFAGIGATGNGVPGESFPDVSAGVKAHLEHLVAYSGEMVPDATSKRTREVQDGIIKQSRRLGRTVRFDDLTKRWAADANYAASMKLIGERFLDEQCTGQPAQIAASAAPTRTPQRPMERVQAGGGGGNAAPPRTVASVVRTVAPVAPPLASTASPAANAPVAAVTPAAGKASGKACRVMTASFGGAAAVLIRSETAQAVTLTALGVEASQDTAQAQRYMQTHAQGGVIVARFRTREAAVEDGYTRCDGGRP